MSEGLLWLLFTPSPPSQYNSSQLQWQLSAFVQLVHLNKKLTILNLANTCFQVIQCQIADLILEAIKIHLESAIEEIEESMKLKAQSSGGCR